MVAAEGSDGAGFGRRQPLSLVVLVVGVLVFAGVALACWSFARQAEDQLLRERADEAAGALTLSIIQVRAPLDTAATLARVTGGDAQYFPSAFEGSLGGGTGTFSSAALFEIGSEQPVATVGEQSALLDGGQSSTAS